MQIDARDDTGGSRVLFRKRHRPQEYLPQEDEKNKKKPWFTRSFLYQSS